jgi:uncharacterized membrane protein
MSQRKGWVNATATVSLGLISLGLMYFAPDSPGHVGLGSLGSAGLLLSVWYGLYLWSSQSALTPGTAAPGERQALISLCAMTLIAAYFSWTLYRVGSAIDLHEQQVRALGHGTSLIVIGWLVVASIQRWREPGVIEDERDRAIRASACGASHTVLVMALIGAILLLGFLPQSLAAAATPLLIAHGLIGALILSALVEHATSLALYRRDRE